MINHIPDTGKMGGAPQDCLCGGTNPEFDHHSPVACTYKALMPVSGETKKNSTYKAEKLSKEKMKEYYEVGCWAGSAQIVIHTLLLNVDRLQSQLADREGELRELQGEQILIMEEQIATNEQYLEETKRRDAVIAEKEEKLNVAVKALESIQALSQISK